MAETLEGPGIDIMRSFQYRSSYLQQGDRKVVTMGTITHDQFTSRYGQNSTMQNNFEQLNVSTRLNYYYVTAN